MLTHQILNSTSLDFVFWNMLSQQNPISKLWIFEFASQHVLSSFFNEVACEIGNVLQVISVTDAEKKEICPKYSLV